MSFELYKKFLTVDGDTQRDITINRTKRELNIALPRTLAYKEVLVDGKPQKVAIISSSTELDTKKITSMPNETINIGSIVEWSNEHWIVYDNDCEDTLYQRGMMYRCNVYLKWQNEKGEIIGRYGYISDSSKQGEGLTHGSNVMNLISQYYKGYFPLDKETYKIRRDKRFLIDIDNDFPDAYKVTNRKTMPYNFNVMDIDKDYELNTKDHLIIFMFSQCENSERDNFEIMVADYIDPNEIIDNTKSTPNDYKIIFKNKPTIKSGGSFKKFSIGVYNANGELIDVPVDDVSWNVTFMENQEDCFEVVKSDDNKSVSIKAEYNDDLINSQVLLSLFDSNNNKLDELYVKVVDIYG